MQNLALGLIILSVAAVPTQNTKINRLRDVRTIYLDEIFKSVRTETFKLELTKRLTESNKVSVVSDPHDANAILSVDVRHGSKYENQGTVSLESIPVNDLGRTVTATETIVFRLSSQQRQILWMFKLNLEEIMGKTERETSIRLAKVLSSKLLKAIEKDLRSPV